MASYRIVCTNQEPASQPTHDAHIVAVGIGDNPDQASQKLTVAEAYAWMDAGHTFYTKGKTSGKIAVVRKWGCRGCSRATLRSDPDAVPDNNLDNLRVCAWS